MTNRMTRWLLVGVLLFATSSALAGQSPESRQSGATQKQSLEARYAALERYDDTNPKLGAVGQAEIERQRRAIKELIRRIEAGEQVAPTEIERALQAH